MKKLALVFAMSLFLLSSPVRSFARDITPAAETEKQAQAAWDEFVKFAKDHNLDAGYQHPAEDVWNLAFIVGDEPKWAVYGYDKLADAVKQIESDYVKYPDGHETRK
jgi:hypothetical protein